MFCMCVGHLAKYCPQNKHKMDASQPSQPKLNTLSSRLVMFRELNLTHQPVLQLDRLNSENHQLLILLNKFSDLFTRGFPRSRVNTGMLDIRLKKQR